MSATKRTTPFILIPLGIVITAGVFVASAFLHKTYSTNLTSVTDTLSSSRLSWVAREAAGNTVGSGVVTLDTTQGAWESTSSANLFTNDTLALANGGVLTSYTVKNILSTSQIEINPVIAAGNAGTGAFMIATRSATHTVNFTTASAVPNGAIRVLIPAISVAANAKDGIPDAGGFDFGAGPTVTCPASVGATYNFVGGTATASAVVVGSTTYHAFECRYSGTGANSQAFTGFTINSLINPAAKAAHVEGTADSYLFIVQNLDATHTVVDQTVGALAVVESVRVTATVDPQITFRIAGVASSVSACGLTTNVTTTSAIVPFGSLTIGAFTVAAQTMSVSTNATNGYTVTAMANDSLGRGGNACHLAGGSTTGNPCIPDSLGDSGTMAYNVSSAWATASNFGFGYTVADPNTTTTLGFTNYRVFPESVVTAQASSPQQLFSGTGVVNNANIYLCYKASISATQQAGDYTNNITYTATATF